MGTLRYKVVIVGDGSVGKTTLILRYTEKRFRESYIPTIGVQWVVKQLNYQESTVYLTIWDIAGQDKFKVMRGTFYDGSDAVIIVFDVTNLISFDHVENWLIEVQQFCDNVPFILLGNKIDLVGARRVTQEMIKSLIQRYNLPYFETSAKTGENVNDMFNKVVENIRQYIPSSDEPLLEDIITMENKKVNLLDELEILEKLIRNNEKVYQINRELKNITNELFKQNPYHTVLGEMTQWRLERLLPYRDDAYLALTDKEQFIHKIQIWKKGLISK
ncbi:MAG: Rab family GTPase [Candidatus Helarchaeota archaeon]